MPNRIESINYLMAWNIFYKALESGCPVIRQYNVIELDYTTKIN